MTHRKLFLGLLVLALATGSIGYGLRGRAEANSPAPLPRYPATQLSDAILFNDGPIAYRLGALWRPPTQWTPALRTGQSAVNAELVRRGSWSETMIGQRVQSGNPFAVRDGLVTLVALAREVFDREFGKATVDAAVLGVNQALLGDEVVRADLVIDWDRSLDDDGLHPLEVGAVQAIFAGGFVDWSWDMAGTPAPQAKLIQDRLIQIICSDLRAG